MDKLVPYLQEYFEIDPVQAKKLSVFFIEEKLEKDTYFLKSEQLCNRLSFIQSGYIRIYNIEKDKEITQWISGPNYFITEISSFMFGNRARWNIKTLSHSVIYTIKKNDYNQLKSTLENWADIEYKFLSKCFITLENRVYNHLSMTAEERYDAFFANNKEMFNEVPLQYIASMLGMSPETLSRIRQKKTS